jgi:hypothetical protein
MAGDGTISGRSPSGHEPLRPDAGELYRHRGGSQTMYPTGITGKKFYLIDDLNAAREK